MARRMFAATSPPSMNPVVAGPCLPRETPTACVTGDTYARLLESVMDRDMDALNAPLDAKRSDVRDSCGISGLTYRTISR